MTRLFNLLVLAFASALPVAAHAQDCAPIKDVDAALSQDSLRYLVLGEMHGTNEAPQFAGDVVCHALERGQPVVLALEYGDLEQGPLDGYLNSDGGTDARLAFLSRPEWRGGLPDGRRSEAMFSLIEQARRMKTDGGDLDVLAVRGGRPPREGDYQAYGEAAMAGRLEAVGAARPEALIVFLVGNIHAAKAPMRDTLPPPAAARLPENETLSLNYSSGGGEAWNCQPYTCGPHPMPARDDLGGQEQIVLSPVSRNEGAVHYDGYFWTPRTTASAPAALTDPCGECTLSAPPDGWSVADVTPED